MNALKTKHSPAVKEFLLLKSFHVKKEIKLNCLSTTCRRVLGVSACSFHFIAQFAASIINHPMNYWKGRKGENESENYAAYQRPGSNSLIVGMKITQVLH